MMPTSFQMRTRIAIASATAAAALLTGCGIGLAPSLNEAASGTAGMGRIQGAVHGGQQPVSGSTIQLYAVTTEGYDAPATAMLTVPVTSTANGSFSITGDYTCTGVDQVYIVATGGNPGLAGNTNSGALALMAALGSCSSVLANASTTFINLNEVTTLPGAWSLVRIYELADECGYLRFTTCLGVENAFATANKIANVSQLAPPWGLLSRRSDSAGRRGKHAGQHPRVLRQLKRQHHIRQYLRQSLFAATTPPGGTAPTDTLTAALNIARDPSNAVPALFALASSLCRLSSTRSNGRPNETNWLFDRHPPHRRGIGPAHWCCGRRCQVRSNLEHSQQC